MGVRRIAETSWGSAELLRLCGGPRYQKDWCRLHVLRHVHIVATQSCPALGWLGICVLFVHLCLCSDAVRSYDFRASSDWLYGEVIMT